MRPKTSIGRSDPIIGIDLGTTNSLVAWCDDKGPRVFLGKSSSIVPSVVRFNSDGQSVEAVGDDARLHAVEHPERTVYSIKRLMGRSVEDIGMDVERLAYQVVEGAQSTARVKVDGRVWSPQEISAVILRRLKQIAEEDLGQTVQRAVITVPAYFDDAQRQATRDAGRLAGLEVVRIVNEPTAAALAYNLDQRHEDSTVAVFDLGGGTFDVSIVRLHSTEQGLVDQVLSTAGDTHLGGDDVDQMIVELIQREVRERFDPSMEFGPGTLQAFRNLAEAVKIQLSSSGSAEIDVQVGQDQVYRRTIDRGELERMMAPWIDRAINACRQAVKATGLGVEDIERVIMVGGSTRIPLVRARVAELFGQEPYTALDPDQVVALGAAVQGSILAGTNRDILLLDVIPLSLGIETVGGAVAKLITSNTTIPTRATEKFSTSVDNQTNIKIHVLQGERELVKDCRSLGEFELRGVPPMPAGLPKIEVTFLVDANGVLNVSAVEKRSEKAASIQVVPNHGLSREEIDQIQRESIEHAREDMSSHRVIDLRNQAKMDLRAIERQLEKVGDQVDDDYRSQIERFVEQVRGFVDQDRPDPDAFHEALDRMDQSTVRLAELAISQTLREQ